MGHEQGAAPARVRHPADFGRVAVLYGGDSAEREVSLRSGSAVCAALRRRGVDVVEIDKGRDVIRQLEESGAQQVFITLHGRGGEDGVIQGTLESMGLAYTGSGVLGSALAMDKHRTKRIWQACGVPTPDFRIVRTETELFAAGRALGFPVAVKPVHEGSSIGVCRARDEEGLHAGWYQALRYDDELIVEPWMAGEEYTVSILGGEVLPPIRLEPARDFYDYTAKYVHDAGTRYHCPSGLAPEREQAFKALSLRAFESVGAEGWGRVDLRCDAAGAPFFLEVNTAPGMTDHSLVPMAAEAVGIDYDELVWRILETVPATRAQGSRTPG